MTKHIPLLPFLATLFWLAWTPPAAAGEKSIEAFFGDYAGRTISSAGDGLTKRDLGVTIRAKGEGFTIDWKTITHKPGGRVTRKAYSINFIPSGRDNIYASAMKTDKFGGRVPLDPLKGEPYVWARVGGDTLSVYAMLVTDEGGYEMQVYERTLTEKGMALKFSRILDGRPLKQITGTLARIGG